MIEINNISKSYDKVVLSDVSAKIPDGSIVGLVGINGVGKSTLLRIIAGVYEPDSGSIIIDGEDISKNPLLKRDIFYVPDNPSFTRFDTPKKIKEHYRFWFNPLTYDVAFIHHLNKFNISMNGKLSKFSKGMKRQTLLALGIALAPKYLFFDEAFDGVDPIARKELKEMLLKNQGEKNSTIILSSHSLRELEDICDTYLVVDKTNLHVYHSVSELDFHKYTMIFDKPYREKDFHIDFVSFDAEGKIITCVTNLGYTQMQEAIKHLEPKFLEEQKMTIDESFMTIVGQEEKK